MNTSVVYKYRTLDGIIKYEVLEGEFGVDSTLHLRDTSCKHYGNNCEIEVVLCEDDYTELCDILELVEKENIDLAYPTQNIYIKGKDEAGA